MIGDMEQEILETYEANKVITMLYYLLTYELS
jgi:hypothetical protein